MILTGDFELVKKSYLAKQTINFGELGSSIYCTAHADTITFGSSYVLFILSVKLLQINFVISVINKYISLFFSSSHSVGF